MTVAMGWARGESRGRAVGYAVRAICDEPGCKTQIDRGLAFVCGQMHGGSETACGGYFCSDHLFMVLGTGQRCRSCADKIEDLEEGSPDD